MKIGGHPVHLMLVHFPSALLPMALFCEIVFYYTQNLSFGTTAFYAAVGGVTMGWLAFCFGFLDLTKIGAEEEKAQRVAMLHGGINTVVLMVYSIFVYRQWQVFPAIEAPTMVVLAIKAAAIILLVAGNYFGGNLVLKYRIGVQHRNNDYISEKT